MNRQPLAPLPSLDGAQISSQVVGYFLPGVQPVAGAVFGERRVPLLEGRCRHDLLPLESGLIPGLTPILDTPDGRFKPVHREFRQ